MKKHLLNHVHKPNWFWVENFHGEKMKQLKNTDFDANTTFYEKWPSVYFVRNQTEVSSNAIERNIKLNAAVTYDEIVKRFAPQGSDCLALFVGEFSRLFLKTLEEEKVTGKVYITSCKYYELGNTTEFDVTYLLG